MDCLLTGVEFVKGWQRELFVAKWSMHQLVCVSHLTCSFKTKNLIYLAVLVDMLKTFL
jgi:hypothetical protein